MKYTYRLHRCIFIDVDIEASDEDNAQDIYESMASSGKFNDEWRDAVLEAEEEVAEVWEDGTDEGICIYSIY